MNVNGLGFPGGGPNYQSLSDSHYYEIHVSCDNGNPNSDYVFQFSPGQRMGGPSANSQVIDEELSVCVGDTVVETVPNYFTGVAIPIGDGIGGPYLAEIPLKVFAPLGIDGTTNTPTVGPGQINWQDYYHLRYQTNYSYTSPNANPNKWVDVQINSPTNYNNNAAEFLMPFPYVGEKTFPADGTSTSAENYETYARRFIHTTSPFMSCTSDSGVTTNRGIKVFVGQRAESFNIDLGRTFDLVNFVPLPGGVAECDSHCDVSGSHVNLISFVVEVPIDCVRCNHWTASSKIIGSWSAVRELYHDEEGNHQVGSQTNRLAQPLINELFIGLRRKLDWNFAYPSADTQFDNFLLYPAFPSILDILFRPAFNSDSDIAPKRPRNDIYQALHGGIPGVTRTANEVFGDLLRLNLAFPATPLAQQDSYGVFGHYNSSDPNNRVRVPDFTGYPNGRRLGDDVVDISLQVAMGALCHPPFDTVLGICTIADAPVGNQPFTDGCPIDATYFDGFFPFS